MKTKEQKRREACERIKRRLPEVIREANQEAFAGNAQRKEILDARVVRMQSEVAHLESFTSAARSEA